VTSSACPLRAGSTVRLLCGLWRLQTTHEERGLKHRAKTDTRRVPIPPDLLTIVGEHLAEFGTAPDGRLFRTRGNQSIPASSYGDTLAAARTLGLTPAQVPRRSLIGPTRHATLPCRCGSTLVSR